MQPQNSKYIKLNPFTAADRVSLVVSLSKPRQIPWREIQLISLAAPVGVLLLRPPQFPPSANMSSVNAHVNLPTRVLDHLFLLLPGKIHL